eukprot:TRINITY_DN2251_c0_g1_i11.p2 TRINITY_DN2251_c0_g1~~TRINITY_DN2251_c0_g1_i11.p2  ORF type:complete len:127 (+),score=17.96 TRINITY_DN2251_c0_g1_i11:47-427(+)
MGIQTIGEGEEDNAEQQGDWENIADDSFHHSEIFRTVPGRSGRLRSEVGKGAIRDEDYSNADVRPRGDSSKSIIDTTPKYKFLRPSMADVNSIGGKRDQPTDHSIQERAQGPPKKSKAESHSEESD